MPIRYGRWPDIGGLLLLAIPVVAWAGTAEAPSRAGSVLFGLALLVVGAKCGGLVAERWGQPSVLGELLVGIGAGNLLPPLFGEQGIAFVRGDPTLHVLAELGVLILLFDVGLEADLRALVRVGPSAALVAAIGVVTPFALGWGTARWFLPEAPPLAHLFIGATLTATSVGITARVLKDLGALQSREGQVILGAAILDDILGLVVLAVVSGLVTATAAGGPGLSEVALTGIVLKAVAFLGITVGLGHYLSGPIVRLAARTGQRGILLVFGLAICFVLAFVAERIGLAGIVGAFAAGLLLDPYGEGVRTRDEEDTLSELLHPLSSLFVPLFFVLMGMQSTSSAWSRLRASPSAACWCSWRWPASSRAPPASSEAGSIGSPWASEWFRAARWGSSSRALGLPSHSIPVLSSPKRRSRRWSSWSSSRRC